MAVGGRVAEYGERWQSVSGNASNVKSSWVEWAGVSLSGEAADWTLNKEAAGRNRTDGRKNQGGGAVELDRTYKKGI